MQASTVNVYLCIFLCSRSLKPPEKHATFKQQDGLWSGQSVHSGATIKGLFGRAVQLSNGTTERPGTSRDASFRAERDGCFCHFDAAQGRSHNKRHLRVKTSDMSEENGKAGARGLEHWESLGCVAV